MDKKNKNYTVNNTYYRNYEVCNNCGKSGHLFHKCKLPITSIGVIVFRICPSENENEPCKIQYLLIRRKETLGYIDFMRGKYSVHNKDYIMNMLKQMTRHEKQQLTCGDFEKLWKFGGYPDPFINGTERFYNRWKNLRDYGMLLLKTKIPLKNFLASFLFP
jgi:hypothetical protein